MTDQILNLLTHKENGIIFADYLKSIGAEIRDITNPYEAARFKLKGKTCVIYYKESKGKFTYSDEFARSIHQEWKRIKKIKKAKGKANQEKIKAKTELYKILGDLKQDPEFVRYINKEFDGYFNIENLSTIEEMRIAYKCILQYRKIFLKENLVINKK